MEVNTDMCTVEILANNNLGNMSVLANFYKRVKKGFCFNRYFMRITTHILILSPLCLLQISFLPNQIKLTRTIR
jgi:hypothetical protein